MDTTRADRARTVASSPRRQFPVSDVAAVLEAVPVAMLVVDVEGAIEFANPEFQRLTGWSASEIVGCPVQEVVPSTTRCRRADGSSFQAEVVSSPVLLDHRGLTVWVIRDESERLRTEAELFDRATHDGLTGLANRSLLADRLEHALGRLSRHPGQLGVLFVDLDRFKQVNDVRGHAAGDAVLCAVAAALAGTVRPVDTVARVGGDEFVVLCESVDADAVRELSDRVRAAVGEATAQQLGPDAGDLRVSASVGVVMSVGGPSADVLIDAADQAMYVAKRAGGDRVEFATPG